MINWKNKKFLIIISGILIFSSLLLVFKNHNKVEAQGSWRQAFIQCAINQLGKQYAWGSSGPNTFDCSGLIFYCYKQATGKAMPYRPGCSKLKGGASHIACNSTWVASANNSFAGIQSGDVVVRSPGYVNSNDGQRRQWGHIGIYVGDFQGRKNVVIHAGGGCPSGGSCVNSNSNLSQRWKQAYHLPEPRGGVTEVAYPLLSPQEFRYNTVPMPEIALTPLSEEYYHPIIPQGFYDWLSYLLSLLLMLGGILATLAIIISGLQYILAVENPALKSNAKDRLQNAIIGLVFLFSFYIILNTIDPELLDLRPRRPEPSPPQPAPVQTANANKMDSFAMAGGNQSRNPISDNVSDIAQPTIEYEVDLNNISSKIPVLIADVNNDSKNELAVFSQASNATVKFFSEETRGLDDEKELSKPRVNPWGPFSLGREISDSPVIVDIDGDGRSEILAVTKNNSLACWTIDYKTTEDVVNSVIDVSLDWEFCLSTGFLATDQGPCPPSPAIGAVGPFVTDVDNNGFPETIIVATKQDSPTGTGTAEMDKTFGGTVYALVIQDLKTLSEESEEISPEPKPIVLWKGFDGFVNESGREKMSIEQGWFTAANLDDDYQNEIIFVNRGTSKECAWPSTAIPQDNNDCYYGQELKDDECILTLNCQQERDYENPTQISIFDGLTGIPMKIQGLPNGMPSAMPISFKFTNKVQSNIAIAWQDKEDNLPTIIIFEPIMKGKQTELRLEENTLIPSWVYKLKEIKTEGGIQTGLVEKDQNGNMEKIIGVVAADLDNDTNDELVISTSLGKVFALKWNKEGNIEETKNFLPITNEISDKIEGNVELFWKWQEICNEDERGNPIACKTPISPPTLADLDADVLKEVVIGSKSGKIHLLENQGLEPSKTSEVLPSGCSCQEWKTNNICGEKGCSEDHILYKRTCTPAGCAPEEQCVINSQCNKSIWELDLKKDLSFPFSHPIIDTDSEGRAEIIVVGKNREGNNGQLFVLGKLDSVKLELTDLSLANLILFEEHIKSIVIDKPINDMIAMSETCSCRDHCDPNRNVSGNYKPCCPEPPCFRFVDNWCVNPGYPAKVNMPDKNPNYCPFTTSQNKTCDVKTDAESINPSVAPINRELRKLLGQGDVTTTTKTGYNYHGRPRLRVEEIKTGNGLPQQEDIQYQELVGLVEKIFKEFLDLCANPSNPSSSCASFEDEDEKQTCLDACFVKRHFDTTRETHNYCEDPETQRFMEKVRAAIKAELVKRNYLFEEGNENLYITNLNKVRDDLFKMNLRVASCKKDTNRLIGGGQTNSLVHCYDIVHQDTKKWETRLGFAERLKVPPESKTYPLSPLNLNEPFFCNVPTVDNEGEIILNPEEQEEEGKIGEEPHYCAWDDFYCLGTADKAMTSPDSWLYSTPQCYSLLKIEQEVLSKTNIECVHEITTYGWEPWKRRYSKINYFKITPQTEKKEIHFSFLEEAFQTIKRTYQLTTELYNKLLKASCWRECDQWCLYIFECTPDPFPIPIRMGPDLCCTTDLESKDIEYLGLDALLNLYPQRIKWPCDKEGNNDWPYPLILAEGRWVKELLGGLYDAWKETKCKIQDEYCDQCKHYYIKYEPREMTSDELAKEETCNICQRGGMEGLPYCEAPCCRGVIENLPDKTWVTTYSSPQFCQKIVDLVQWFESPPRAFSSNVTCLKNYVENYITNILPSESNFDEALRQALDPRTQLTNFTRELADLRSLTPEEFYNQLKSELESMTDEEIEKYIQKELEKIGIKKSDAENTIKDIKAQLETIKNANLEELLNKELTKLSGIDPNKFKKQKIEEISGFIELQEQKIIRLRIEVDTNMGIQVPEKIETTTQDLERVKRELERRSRELTSACQQIPTRIDDTQNAITELKNKIGQGDLTTIKNQISNVTGKITNLEDKIDTCLQGNVPSDLKTMLVNLKNTLGSFKSLIVEFQRKIKDILDIQNKLEDWIREKTRIEGLAPIRVLQEEIKRLGRMSPQEFIEELIEKLGMKEELAKLKWVFAELEKIQIESLSPDDFIAAVIIDLEREGVNPANLYQEKIKEFEDIIKTLERKIDRINQIIDLIEKFTKEGSKKTGDLKKEFWQQIENLEKKTGLPPDLLAKINNLENEIGNIVNEIENLKKRLKDLKAESLSDKLELEIREKIADLQEILDFLPGEIETILDITGILDGGLADITGGLGDLMGQISIIGAIQNLQLLQDIQAMADQITSQLEIIESVGGIVVDELITRLSEVVEILKKVTDALEKVEELQKTYLGEISKILEDLSIPFLEDLEEIEGLKELRMLLEIAESFEEDTLSDLQEELQKVLGWQFPGGVIIEEFPAQSHLGTQICFAYERKNSLAFSLPNVNLGIPSLTVPVTCGSTISPRIGEIGPAELVLLTAIDPETLEIDMDLISRLMYVLPKSEALKLIDQYHLLDCIKTEAEGTAPSWIGSFCGSSEDIYVSGMIDEMPRGQKIKQQCDMMDVYFDETNVQKLQDYYLAKENYGGVLWQKMIERNSFYRIIQDIIEEVQTRDVQDYLQYWQYVEAVDQTKRMVDDLGKENLILLLITSGL